MNELVNRALAAWQSFYLIIGSAAAALIGIQFVVMTLIANMRRATTADSVRAFGTPTVVQLASALIVSVLLNVPWPSLLAASAALALCGLGGLWQGTVVIRSVRRQTDYLPEQADWLWYALLPCGAYALLAIAALCLRIATSPALFAIGAAALGLLLIGIHNAWDAVTHLIVVRPAGGADCP
jgi:hypothetical protein